MIQHPLLAHKSTFQNIDTTFSTQQSVYSNLTTRGRFIYLSIKGLVKTITHLALGIFRLPTFISKKHFPSTWKTTVHSFSYAASYFNFFLINTFGILTPRSSLDYIQLRNNLTTPQLSLPQKVQAFEAYKATENARFFNYADYHGIFCELLTEDGHYPKETIGGGSCLFGSIVASISKTYHPEATTLYEKAQHLRTEVIAHIQANKTTPSSSGETYLDQVMLVLPDMYQQGEIATSSPLHPTHFPTYLQGSKEELDALVSHFVTAAFNENGVHQEIDTPFSLQTDALKKEIDQHSDLSEILNRLNRARSNQAISQFLDQLSQSPVLANYIQTTYLKAFSDKNRPDYSTWVWKQVENSPTLKEALFNAYCEEMKHMTTSGQVLEVIAASDLLKHPIEIYSHAHKIRLNQGGHITPYEKCGTQYTKPKVKIVHTGTNHYIAC